MMGLKILFLEFVHQKCNGNFYAFQHQWAHAKNQHLIFHFMMIRRTNQLVIFSKDGVISAANIVQLHHGT